MLPASMLRRVAAVVVDFLFIYAFWVAFGLLMVAMSLPSYAWLGVAVYLIAIDLPLTARFGLSLGRAATGIRVIRLSDGQAPGWRRAALRIALVVVTGAPGLLIWNLALGGAHFLGANLGPFRLWWDAAAGTALVRSTRWGPTPPISNTDLEDLRRAY